MNLSDSGPDLVSLSSISPQDKPWDIHRLEASEVAALYLLSDFPQYGKRINDCCRRLGFALLSDDNGTVSLKLREARCCRVRHCSVCQWRRSLMWRARFFEALPKISEDFPSHRFIFLTLTVKNCDLSDLRETVCKMNQGFKRLTELKAWPGVGWLKSIEVTRSSDGTAHPHFHCLLMVKTTYFNGSYYLKHNDWVQLWKKSLRISYDPVVNVKAVKQKFNTFKPEQSIQLMKAITETVKYSVKPSDIIQAGGVDWLNGLTEQLKNTRAISLGGVFKQYLSDKEPEDLINTEAESDDEQSTDLDPKLYFGWREKYAKYLKE